MAKVYKFNRTANFKRKYKKVVKKNSSLIDAVASSLRKIANMPFDTSLRTHKVISQGGDKAWSSRVNENIRILWDYNDDSIEILDLLDLGGHSGKGKVYN